MGRVVSGCWKRHPDMLQLKFKNNKEQLKTQQNLTYFEANLGRTIPNITKDDLILMFRRIIERKHGFLVEYIHIYIYNAIDIKKGIRMLNFNIRIRDLPIRIPKWGIRMPLSSRPRNVQEQRCYWNKICHSTLHHFEKSWEKKSHSIWNIMMMKQRLYLEESEQGNWSYNHWYTHIYIRLYIYNWLNLNMIFCITNSKNRD